MSLRERKSDSPPPIGHLSFAEPIPIGDTVEMALEVLDDLDNRLLNEVQWRFPLTRRPYHELASRLDLTADKVISRLEAAKELGVLRQLSAIFDTRALGYKSSLVAARIDPSAIDEVAAKLNEHPGISHNYKRNHEFNLWYTLAVPPGSSFEDHIRVLHRLSQASSTRVLPTLKLFKIGVKLDMTGTQKSTEKAEVQDSERPDIWIHTPAPRLDEDEIRAIRVLQEDLPLVHEPFDLEAQEMGISGSELVALAEDFIRRKLMRRFAAVMNHRSAGYKANAMAVWCVPEEIVEETGYKMASFASVSHCYRRPTYEDWPYSVFTMLHGRQARDIEAAVDAISAETGIEDYALLWSVKEYKKVRVRYYTPEWEAWESRYLTG
jgi:DNA-binding Lrp family transcriptional regulator